MSFQSFNVGRSKQSRPARPTKGFDSDSEDSEQQAGPGPGSVQTAAQLQEAGDRAAAAGQWGTALRHWDAALAQSPNDAHKIHEQQAQVWLEVGEDWKAVQCAQRAVDLQPGWAAGHLTLSRAQLNLGEPELALQSMERVLQLEPGHPEGAAEIDDIRSVVLQRQASGKAGQRARVVGQAARGGAGA